VSVNKMGTRLCALNFVVHGLIHGIRTPGTMMWFPLKCDGLRVDGVSCLSVMNKLELRGAVPLGS